MSESVAPDGGHVQAYTVRLELVDEPGELLNALQPIAEHGGNLLSIFHERGNVTPQGRIPVEIDVECHPDRIEDIVEGLRSAGVNVVKAGEERYNDQVSVLLIGDLIATDLSDTISQIDDHAGVSVTDLSMSAPEGTDDTASARLRIGTDRDRPRAVLEYVHEVADGKGLTVVEPQIDRGGDH